MAHLYPIKLVTYELGDWHYHHFDYHLGLQNKQDFFSIYVIKYHKFGHNLRILNSTQYTKQFIVHNNLSTFCILNMNYKIVKTLTLKLYRICFNFLERSKLIFVEIEGLGSIHKVLSRKKFILLANQIKKIFIVI